VNDFIPPQIQREVALLEKHTGHRPDVERFDNVWRITMRNDRVLMTMDWRRGRSRNWPKQRTHSTLVIDGVPCTLARDIHHFAVLWKDPGLAGQDPDEIAPIPGKKPRADLVMPQIGEVPKGTDVPFLIEALYRAHTCALPAGSVTLGYLDETWRLLIVATTGSGKHAELLFECPPGPDRKHRSVLLLAAIDGKDYTSEIDGDFETALQRLLDAGGPELERPRTVGHSRQAAVQATGVQVRKTTVIRT
jgi:hypothetical protein